MMSDTSPDTPTADVDNAQVNAVTPDSNAEGKESPDRMTADEEKGQDDAIAKEDAATAAEDDSIFLDVRRMEEGEGEAFKDEVFPEVICGLPSFDRPVAAPIGRCNPRNRLNVISLSVLAACVVGALIITVVSIVTNKLTHAEIALLITFAALAMCVVPISCYCGLTCQATDSYFH
jgi:hypothetical protein